MDEEKMSTDNQNTEEAPPASKSAFSDDAIAAISEQRKLKQVAIVEAAELRGKVAGMQETAAKAAPPAISPLDTEIARQTADGIAEEDMTVSPTIYRKHEVWKEQVANQKAETAAKTAKGAVLEESRRVSKTKHPDWMDVVTTGTVHLTDGELLDLENAGVDFGEKAYEKCQSAIERAKPKSETPAPEKKPGEPEAEEKVPTQKEILAEVEAIREEADPQAAAVADM